MVRVELDLPDEPLVNLLAGQAAKAFPQFLAMKKLADLAMILDPNLRNTLTTIDKQLQRAGVVGNELEITAKVSGLEGQTVRIRYVNGVGVIGVEVVDSKLPADLLQDLADRAAPLMDAFLFDAADKKEGERHKVRARDVAGLLPFGRDGVATGWIALRRDKDEIPAKVGRIQVEDSEIIIEGRRTAAEERARLAVESGLIRCSLDNLYVMSANMKLKAGTLFRSKDHLLFRAQQLRNLETDVTYRAEPAR